MSRGLPPPTHRHTVAQRQLQGFAFPRWPDLQPPWTWVQAALASGVVDACLIPEVKFEMGGEPGLLAYVESVLERKGHAVVCIAEGAAQVSGSVWVRGKMWAGIWAGLG